MVHLIYAFIYMLEVFVIYIYFEHVFSANLSSKCQLSVYLIAFLMQYGIYFLNQPMFNLISFLLIAFLLAFLFYKAKIRACIFHVCMLSLFMIVTEMLIVYFSSTIFDIGVKAFNDSMLILIAQSMLSKLLFFMLSYLVAHMHNKRDREIENIPMLLTLSVIPLVSIMYLFIFLVFWAPNNENSATMSIYFSMGALLLFTNIILFLVYEWTRKTNIQYIELLLEQQREKISSEHYESLMAQHESYDILQHDFKRHLRQINEMASLADTQAIRKYVQPICDDFGLNERIIYNGNKFVDVIVNRHVRICEAKGIQIVAEVRNASLDFMDDHDITAILDNLLENAVEAASNAEAGSISLAFNEKNNNFVVINLRNSCAVPPTIKDGKLISSKRDRRSHGIGLKSIHRIVRKYRGNITWSFDAESEVLQMIVILNKTRS